MKGPSLKKVAFGAIIILFLGLIVLASVPENETSPSPTEGKRSHYPIWIKGLTATTFRDDKIINRIKTDELMINPRRFFIFSIKPFNELTFTNLRLEIHLNENEEIFHENTNPFSLEEYIPSFRGVGNDLKGLGFLTRGVINGLVLEIYKGNTLSLLIYSKKAYIDFKKKKTDLIMCSIMDKLSGKRVASRLITWDNREKIFKIPGDYIAQTPSGMAKGKNINIDLDFRVSHL